MANIDPRSLLMRLARLFLSSQFTMLDTFRQLTPEQQAALAAWITAAEEHTA